MEETKTIKFQPLWRDCEEMPKMMSSAAKTMQEETGNG